MVGVHVLFAVVFNVVVVDQATCSSFPKWSLGSDNLGVVGGSSVAINKNPYQVYYVVNDHHACGGVIISENYILTAAHCLWEAHTVDIRAGSKYHDRGFTPIPMASYKIHPQYVVGLQDFDVAVIKTQKPIKFTNSIKTIGLPEKNRPMKEGTIVTISGWGKLSEDGVGSPDLQAVDIPVISSVDCRKLYEDLTAVTENMWCAGVPSGGKDACQGDSGGPAVQDGIVVGIVSFGYGCARQGKPGVYTNVAAPKIRDFISSYTGL